MSKSYNTKEELSYLEEMTKLIKLVDEFSKEMKTKLVKKLWDGYYGWDEPRFKQTIIHKLSDHTLKLYQGDNNQTGDIANLAAFLWKLNKEEEKMK